MRFLPPACMGTEHSLQMSTAGSRHRHPDKLLPIFQGPSLLCSHEFREGPLSVEGHDEGDPAMSTRSPLPEGLPPCMSPSVQLQKGLGVEGKALSYIFCVCQGSF